MNKLTEIKQAYEILEDGVALIPDYTILAAVALKDVNYLLSLLEEKDKALSFYADENNHKWSHTYDETGEVEELPSKVANDRGRLARKSLNTSSNNEGD